MYPQSPWHSSDQPQFQVHHYQSEYRFTPPHRLSGRKFSYHASTVILPAIGILLLLSLVIVYILVGLDSDKLSTVDILFACSFLFVCLLIVTTVLLLPAVRKNPEKWTTVSKALGIVAFIVILNTAVIGFFVRSNTLSSAFITIDLLVPLAFIAVLIYNIGLPTRIPGYTSNWR